MSRSRTTFLVAALVLAASTAAHAQQKREPSRAGWLGFSFDSRPHVVDTRAASRPVVVERVADDSPAKKAGLAVGDTITRLNGLTATPRLVSGMSAGLQAGDTVRLDVRRAGKTRELALVAEPRPARYVSPARVITIDGDSVIRSMRVYLDSARVLLDSVHLPRVRIERGDSGAVYFEGPDGRVRIFPRVPLDSLHLRLPDVRVYVDSACAGCGRDVRVERLRGPLLPFELGRRAVAGAELTELEPTMAEYFKVKEGLLVVRVAPGTPAARAGLEPGDVIVRAAGEAVHDVNGLRRQLRSRSEKRGELEIVRKGKEKTVKLPSE